MWISRSSNLNKYIEEFNENPIDDNDILSNFVKGICLEYMKKDKSLPKENRKEYKVLSRDSFEAIKMDFLFAFVHYYNRNNKDSFMLKEGWKSFDSNRNWFELTLQDINQNDRKSSEPFFF